MSSDPWGFDDEPFAGDEQFGSPGTAARKAPSRALRLPVLAAVSALVAALVLVFSLLGAPGYGAVIVAALAYLLAALVDLKVRDRRFASRKYKRPWLTVVLRGATFTVALVVAWLAASSLAGTT